MLLISPNFDVKSIIFSQFWPGAFAAYLIIQHMEVNEASFQPLDS